MEKFVQARMGGNRPAETTGKWIATSFEHDSARPVNGYAAPQLHTHVVLFNLTEAKDVKHAHYSRTNCTGRNSLRPRFTVQS
jgi:hypothetical protein